MSARQALQKQFDAASAAHEKASANYRKLLKEKPTQDPDLRKACDEASELANEKAAIAAALAKMPVESLKAVK